MSALPLNSVEDSLFPRLGKVLWGWEFCNDLESEKECNSRSCPHRRIGQLQRFFQFYKALILNYVDSCSPENRLFKTHQDLHHAILQLKANPDLTRAELCDFIANQGAHRELRRSNLLNASSLVVNVLTMIDCSALYQSPDRLETGTYRLHWKDDVLFSKYIQDLFPTTSHPILSFNESLSSIEMKSELRAVKLQKRLRMRFRDTHDIQDHLKWDRNQNTLEIYHHTAFLKEQLRLTKSDGDFSLPSNSIRVGALPRQLVLEILDSLQSIIFPLSEPKSKRLLRSLTERYSLDPDIQHLEVSAIRKTGEESIEYVFLADRLAELHNELQTPRPRGWLGRRLERKSGARYMLMATLCGVAFAVLLGMASLAVTCYQTWVAYQAWQHPVSPLGP
ncbi:hypothetical protein QC762_501100 [Podospora pseudocomata]|uniref:F-box domain-containing protein n=1 Tax=Podospora pseudocomata TaxID=2093779 RepID=A0ABR0GAB5_9PEZI|nr:hypothetical protein QC762_501100 [Podospora pseudocomata]